MSGVVGFFTRNFWQESPPRDPELGIPPREGCCLPERVFRDWTQYVSTAAIALAVVGVGYGYFDRNYVVASVAALLAITIFMNCFRVWCLMPAVRLSRSVRAVAEERKKTKQELDQATANLDKLQTEINDLHTNLETEKQLLAQEKVQNQDTIQGLRDQNARLEENRQKYEALKTTYDTVLAGLKAQEAQVQAIRATSKTVKQASKVIGKEKDRLTDSTADLHAGVDRLDDKNDEFDGENEELLGHLNRLETQIKSMGTYVTTLERLLGEINEAKEAAERALAQANAEDSLAATLADAAAVLAASESDLSRSGDA